MNYLIYLFLGFGALWAGLNLFDDEVILIVAILVGCGLVLAGLFASPLALKVAIEVVLVGSLFLICMECVERGS